MRRENACTLARDRVSTGKANLDQLNDRR